MSFDFRSVQSLVDLTEKLRDYKSWGDAYVYDFGATIEVWCALIDNLRMNAVEGELEVIGNYLDQEQKDFVLKIAEYIKHQSSDD